MTASSSIDYDALTQEALRGVVRKILTQVIAKGGLPGDHHFYIAFNTQAPGVALSRRLKEKYPDEMMIVLQHRFWDLAVTEEGFEVKLTFDGIPERLYVPFESLRVFFDPSVRFTLQFGDSAAVGDDTDGRRRRDGDPAGRAGGERRGRPRPVQGRTGRSDASGDAPPPPPAQVPAAGAPPAPTPLPGPSPLPAPVPVPVAPAAIAPRPVAVPAAAPPPEPPAKEAGGAKVFSLDQFRKK